jgi:hypothetical protein
VGCLLVNLPWIGYSGARSQVIASQVFHQPIRRYQAVGTQDLCVIGDSVAGNHKVESVEHLAALGATSKCLVCIGGGGWGVLR